MPAVHWYFLFFIFVFLFIRGHENLRAPLLVSLFLISVLSCVALVEVQILGVGAKTECSPASREVAGATDS